MAAMDVPNSCAARRAMRSNCGSALRPPSRLPIVMEAVGGLKPASIARDEADGGHGCAEQLRCQACDAVELRIGRRIEDAAAVQGGQSEAFGQSSGHS